MKSHRLLAAFALVLALVLLYSCSKGIEMKFEKFVDAHVSVLAPLEREANLAYWQAANSGSDEDYKRYSELQNRVEKLYTNRKDFEFVKKARGSGKITDPELRRIADVLYLRYLGNQADTLLLREIIDLATAAEKKFSVYRAIAAGETLSTNDVYRVLTEEKKSARRKAVWEASKNVGPIVKDDLLTLVELRNQAAKQAGFPDYYTMSLTLNEQKEEFLVKLFDELDELTREAFLEAKADLDGQLAKQYGIKVEDLRPWHYHDPYFQEVPQVGDINLDKYYAGKDLVAIARAFYASIGMPVEDILERSDLYERPGKNPHAFCTDIDREGDIRILANMKDNGYWMETILHELGHAVYDKYIDRNLPYLIRTYPASLLTEASAEFFGRLAQDPQWIRAALGISGEGLDKTASALEKSLRLKQLIFARWSQVMFRFERELYRNPNQDLNKLWWDLVERYQFVKRPEGRDMPDWATKIHMVMNPVYYHNYLIGELVASQVHHYIYSVLLADKPGAGISGNPQVGEWFKEKYYGPGNLVPWNEHIERATGEPLTARYFAEQFAKGEI